MGFYSDGDCNTSATVSRCGAKIIYDTLTYPISHNKKVF